MPQPKDFKFTLEWKGKEYEFKNSPDGWFDYSTSWVRQFSYHGYTRGFTERLRFIKEAADLLRKAYDEKGIEAVVYLKVYRLKRLTWEYELDYTGELDFSQYTDDELYGEINVKTAGAQQLLEAYRTVDYDVAIGTDYRINVPEGVKLREDVTDVIATMVSANNTTQHKIPVYVTGGETYTDSLAFNDVSYGGATSGDPHFVKKDNLPTILRITTKIGDNNNPIIFWSRSPDGNPTNTEYRLSIINFDTESTATSLGKFPMRTGGDTAITLDKEVTITSPGRYYIFGAIHHIAGPLDGGLNQYISGALKFEYMGSTDPFFFYGMPLREYFKKMGEKMGITQPFTSQLLSTGEGKDVFVTSGDGIRNLDNPAIHGRFHNLYQATNVILNIGMGIKNEGMVVEKKESFYDRNRLMLDIGEVTNLQVVPATEDWLYNTIEVGYEDQTYDEMNGRDEFNTLLHFTTPITKYREKFDLVSPIRADSYGIQFTKLNLENKESTDSSSDNKTFFVVVKPTASGYEVDRDKEEISGTINPTGIFNVFLSPKRCLLRHASYLSAILSKQSGEVVFASIAKQQSDITSRLAGESQPVVEKANIPITELLKTPPMFSPNIAKFTTLVPYNLPYALGSNPTGYIAFSSNGVRLKGFIVKVVEKPAQRKEQEWELLLHPDTPGDLLKRLRDKTGRLIR